MLWCAGCVPPLVVQVDAGIAGSVASAPPLPEPYDPCAWDGQGERLCAQETAVVFDGTACRPVCGPEPRHRRPGVFATLAACEATCPCNPEKFVLWPAPGSAGPFAVGGYCGGVEAVTDGGVTLPWPAASCQEARFWAWPPDQTCSTGLGGQLTRRELANICRVSALPQVKQVVCVVWVD